MRKKLLPLFFSILLTSCKTMSNEPQQKITTSENEVTSSTNQELTTTYSDAQNAAASIENSKKRLTAEEMCESVLNSIQNEDCEQLKLLFCNEIVTSHNLDKELAAFFNSVDGKFVYFTDYHAELHGAGERKGGVYVKYFIDSHIRVAKTDTDNKYEITFYANLVYDKDPNKIGLEYLIITNSEGEELWVGDYIDN